MRQHVSPQAARFGQRPDLHPERERVGRHGRPVAEARGAGEQVKLGSKEYVALLGKHPDASAWLSVGRNVQVVLGGEVVEVVE